MARQTRNRRAGRDAATEQPAPTGRGERAREAQRKRAQRAAAEAKTQTGRRRERGGTRRFLGECVAELKKVDWPGQRQIFTATVVVIIAIFVVGLYLWVVDEAFSRLVKNVFLRN